MIRVDGAVNLVVEVGPLNGFGDVAPFVGLRHDAIEDLKSDLMELPRDALSATVGGNVGIVLGSTYQSWPSSSPLEPVVDAVDRGVAIMETYARPDRLSAALEAFPLRVLEYSIRVPVYLYLGDRVQAERWLALSEPNECRAPGPMCEQFRRFARNTRAWLALHEGQ
jgi:hypothetical protein